MKKNNTGTRHKNNHIYLQIKREGKETHRMEKIDKKINISLQN